MTKHARTTPTQDRILAMVHDAHVELQMGGYDQRMGQDGVYVRDPDVRIVGSDVFGYDADGQKKVRRVMYPIGWSEAITREARAMAEAARADEEPPL